MVSEKPKAMIVNVGGATSPAVHILNGQQPPFICFFVSGDSKHLIKEKILPNLNYNPEHYDWIETKVPQDLLECYRVLVKKLPDIFEKWGVDPTEVAVEYTSGTKPMSVAVILATIDHSSQYFYVGSKDAEGRDKEGIGVVLDGKEYTWFQSNPWVELAVRAKKDIALLFNHGRFVDAKERAEKLAQVVPPDMQVIYQALAELIDGYALWDRFDYKSAQQKIYHSLNTLKSYSADRNEPIRESLNMIEKNADFLRRLNDKSNPDEHARLDLLDLVANAERRARVARKYDDAVARLYSALEGIARNRLLSKYQIKNSNVQPQQIPEAVRQLYIQNCVDHDGNQASIKLGLEESYKLLADLNDDLGKKYLSKEKELSKLLYARNQSRLAHGTEPIGEDTYQKMFEIIIEFGNINEDDLPAFPVLNL